MIRFVSAGAADLRTIASRLRSIGYGDAVARLTAGAPAFLYRRMMRELADSERPVWADDPVWAALSLLFLGRPIAAQAAADLFGEHIGALRETSVVDEAESDIACQRVGLVPIEGGLYFVSRLKHAKAAPESNAAYLGPDTLELLAEARRDPSASVLELGCGGGIVGVDAARANGGRRLLGVDLCAEAVEIARLNAAFNGVSYDARLGDLYEPVDGERFDLVLADPPSVAVPDDLAFPLYGSGGPEGDRLLKRIVEGVDDHLEPGGRLFAITELHCEPGRIPFVGWGRAWTRGRQGRWMTIDVVACRRLPPEYHQSLGDNLDVVPGSARIPGRAGSRLASYAAKRRLFFGYWVRVSAGFDPGLESRFAIHWRFDRATPRSEVQAVEGRALHDEVRRLYRVTLEEFDDAFQWFVDAVPGRGALSQVAGRFDRAGHAGLTTYFVDLATAMSQLGLVRFTRPRRAS